MRYFVPDNLQEGVIKPDLCEPELNAVYAALLAHRCVADPARVRDPNRKGTVENAIQHTQATALKGRRFQTLAEQNAFLEHWECNWAAKCQRRFNSDPPSCLIAEVNLTHPGSIIALLADHCTGVVLLAAWPAMSV